MNCGRDLAPLLPLCHCETQGNQSALWWIRLQDERTLLLFFLKYTNNIKPVPICYVPARSLLLFLPPFFSASHLPLLSLLKRLAGCCHPSLSPSLPPFLHIHFMLNWWIKLSLAQNQSWLALPYSFTLDRNPKEKGAREGERDGGRGVRGIRDWEREKHWDTDKAQSHYMSF